MNGLKGILMAATIVGGFAGIVNAQESFHVQKLTNPPKVETVVSPAKYLSQCPAEGSINIVVYPTTDPDVFQFYETAGGVIPLTNRERNTYPWLRFSKSDDYLYGNTNYMENGIYNFKLRKDSVKDICDIFENLGNIDISD